MKKNEGEAATTFGDRVVLVKMEKMLKRDGILYYYINNRFT